MYTQIIMQKPTHHPLYSHPDCGDRDRTSADGTELLPVDTRQAGFTAPDLHSKPQLEKATHYPNYGQVVLVNSTK
jgi:hypothetical protein